MEGNHVFCITFPVLFFWDTGAADSTDSYSTQMAFSGTPHDGLLSLALVCLCSGKFNFFYYGTISRGGRRRWRSWKNVVTSTLPVFRGEFYLGKKFDFMLGVQPASH